MEKKILQIFAEHYEILLHDTAGARTNRKRKAMERCSYVLETIMDLFSEIFNISFREAHKVLYNIAFPDKEKGSVIHVLPEDNTDNVFRKFYRAQSELLTTEKDSTSTKAAAAACEIVTIFAELHSLSYDRAATLLNSKRDGEIVDRDNEMGEHCENKQS